MGHKYAVLVTLPTSPDYPREDDRTRLKEQLRQQAEKVWPGAKVLYLSTTEK